VASWIWSIIWEDNRFKPYSTGFRKFILLLFLTFLCNCREKAPDFSAPAYHQGKFTSVKLSEYLGKWVVLCFYPGDFTFV
jgi:hypothetical protein